MRLVIKRVIDKVCCRRMQEALDDKNVTHNEWNFFFGNQDEGSCWVIFYCPWCGEDCM